VGAQNGVASLAIALFQLPGGQVLLEMQSLRHNSGVYIRKRYDTYGATKLRFSARLTDEAPMVELGAG
jgi:hypothetical protein